MYGMGESIFWMVLVVTTFTVSFKIIEMDMFTANIW